MGTGCLDPGNGLEPFLVQIDALDLGEEAVGDQTNLTDLILLAREMDVPFPQKSHFHSAPDRERTSPPYEAVRLHSEARRIRAAKAIRVTFQR